MKVKFEMVAALWAVYISEGQERKVTARCTEHLPDPGAVATFRSWRSSQGGIIRDLAITLRS